MLGPPFCYLIMQYIPCFDLTPSILVHQKNKNRTKHIITKNLLLPRDDVKEMLMIVDGYDFYNNDIFTYESSSIFLTVFYKPTNNCEYIVIYF